jgi:hypothetical protein
MVIITIEMSGPQLFGGIMIRSLSLYVILGVICSSAGCIHYNQRGLNHEVEQVVQREKRMPYQEREVLRRRWQALIALYQAVHSGALASVTLIIDSGSDLPIRRYQLIEMTTSGPQPFDQSSFERYAKEHRREEEGEHPSRSLDQEEEPPNLKDFLRDRITFPITIFSIDTRILIHTPINKYQAHHGSQKLSWAIGITFNL